MRILIIEDEAPVLATLSANLTNAGHQILTAGTGELGLVLARKEALDLIILDIGLPGMDGMEVASSLRGDGDTTPIIFLSARDSEADVVEGLDLGADGYMTKPFSIRELQARLRAVERRRTMDREQSLAFGGLVLDPRQRHVARGDKRLRLTDVEFRLLSEIIGARGEVRKRSDLLKAVWRIDFDTQTGLLDVHMSNLRKKLARIGAPAIETVRGVGFRMVPPEG